MIIEKIGSVAKKFRPKTVNLMSVPIGWDNVEETL